MRLQGGLALLESSGGSEVTQLTVGVSLANCTAALGSGPYTLVCELARVAAVLQPKAAGVYELDVDVATAFTPRRWMERPQRRTRPPICPTRRSGWRRGWE